MIGHLLGRVRLAQSSQKMVLRKKQEALTPADLDFDLNEEFTLSS